MRRIGTPGPWTNNLDDGPRLQGWTVYGRDTHSDADFGDTVEVATVHARIDVPLITAAPYMLDALEACDKAFAEWEVIPDGIEEDLIVKVRVALAHARGSR